jgi:hypothetical protein
LSKIFCFLLVGALVFGTALGCAGSHVDEPEAASLPADVRADYAVFALRCSKCHSLARPLNSGIDNDEYWKMYVERMRRQPASGISVADTVPILRFLHVFSIEERKKKGEQLDLPPPDAGALPDAGPAVDAGLPLAPRAP